MNSIQYDLQIARDAGGRACCDFWARRRSQQMQQHTLPLVLAGLAWPTWSPFIRIVNRSDTAGEVTIHGIDDSGTRSGPATLSLAANQTQHLRSSDLEDGNAALGLSGESATTPTATGGSI